MSDKTIKFDYSAQAIKLINNLKDFNREEFEKHFISNVPVGSRNILDYIINKPEVKKDG